MKFPIIGKVGYLGIFIFALSVSCSKKSTDVVIDDSLRRISIHPDPVSVGCAKCHQPIFDEWAQSQHALANRLVSESEDGTAFNPAREIAHGSFVTRMQRGRSGSFDFVTSFSNQPPETFRAEAVIGITPLRQYLVTYPGGRLQVMDMSYDPRSNEWFNAFGNENRQPHEWGHWRGRSMTWNVQCAFCHMTGFEKKYDIREDRYASTWKAMGISCTQCHRLKDGDPVFGAQISEITNHCPMVQSSNYTDSAHPEHQTPHPDRDRAMDNCASCHARREELFGTFKPGDSFHNHFRLTLPDQPGIFHADGQVRDEDFEYASFMMSRMGHRGVSCLDCHNPHSGKLVAPVEDNALCMKCHVPPGLNGAIAIDPVAHSFHKPGTPGGRCVDCHMPVNFYMVRDGRRDHGFTSPDPLLTIEHGIPNACNRCHTDQSPEWAHEFTQQWYGDKMNRRARDRARVVARYHKGDGAIAAQLLSMAASEEIVAWRAALVGMLAPWNQQPDVQSFLLAEQRHASPLVRSAAIRSLGAAIEPTLNDPSALVRVDATFANYQQNPSVKPPAFKELLDYINNISDQPAGAMRQAHLATIENRVEDAEAWLVKTVQWDPVSALPRYQLGRHQFSHDKQAQALSNLYAAASMETNNAEYSFSLALALAEVGQADISLKWLEETVRRDRQFGRGWYNLGLAYASAERLPEAVKALQFAETLLPGSGDPAYARATVHLRMGDPVSAREAVAKALWEEPSHIQAMALRQKLYRK